MAVQITPYEKMLEELGSGNINFAAGDIKLALCSGGASLNAVGNHMSASTWASLSAFEVTQTTTAYAASTDYQDNGATMTHSWASAGNDTYRFDASDVTFGASAATISAHAAVIWYSKGAAAGSKWPLFHIYFGGSVQADPGTKLIIQWNASGIFEISAATASA